MVLLYDSSEFQLQKISNSQVNTPHFRRRIVYDTQIILFEDISIHLFIEFSTLTSEERFQRIGRVIGIYVAADAKRVLAVEPSLALFLSPPH
ncbi:MAG: hypothetical protein DRP27_02740 [Thermotogae bacterium]|nr:MAG: hypothetical protein DRP27_02740 [Thermotogota bacterium]